MLFYIHIILSVFWINSLQNDNYQYSILKHPDSMFFSDYKVIYDDSRDLMCSFYSLIGEFETCPEYELKGFFIKTPYSLAKNIVILDFQNSDDSVFKRNIHFYSFKSGDFIEKFQLSSSKIETIQFNSTLFNEKVALKHGTKSSIKKHQNSTILDNENDSILLNLKDFLESRFENINSNKPFMFIYTQLEQFHKFDLKDKTEINGETLVLLREPLLTDKSELIKDMVKTYSDNFCTMNESITCDEIPEAIKTRLCAIKSNYFGFGNIACVNSNDLAAIQQRDDIAKEDHNLYTYAEFNFEYPFVFSMCFGVGIVLIILMIVFLLTLANIDSSSYSILYREAPTKQKSD